MYVYTCTLYTYIEQKKLYVYVYSLYTYVVQYVYCTCSEPEKISSKVHRTRTTRTRTRTRTYTYTYNGTKYRYGSTEVTLKVLYVYSCTRVPYVVQLLPEVLRTDIFEGNSLQYTDTYSTCIKL